MTDREARRAERAKRAAERTNFLLREQAEAKALHDKNKKRGYPPKKVELNPTKMRTMWWLPEAAN